MSHFHEPEFDRPHSWENITRSAPMTGNLAEDLRRIRVRDGDRYRWVLPDNQEDENVGDHKDHGVQP